LEVVLMLSLFDVIGHAGTLVSILAVAAAVAALVYVPSPLKHYAVAACLCAALASQIYAEGYHHADAGWQARYDRQIAAINDENEKAVIAAEQKARAEAAANAANLKAQLDDLARQKAASDADLAAAQALIDAAPQDAKPDGPDAPAPAVILDAIRGK
jgi:Tfp pilus assembly protein FimV